MKAKTMNVKVLFLTLCLITLAACKKDKYETKPQLTFKKVETPVLSSNDQILKFFLNVTDKEGDIQDTLWVQKITLNCASGSFVSKYKVPNFTPIANVNAELSVSFQKGNNYDPNYVRLLTLSQCNKNDTCIFKFWIQDNAKNKSDTVTSPTIVITK
ncbi:MAG: hypothetical protein JWN76_2916 [Chitinophagaceae bacterium]|nr:hypothetical protein [Chitinophagaceae bacterium]